MPPKLNLYSHSPMPTPPSSPEEGEEENAIFDASEEENNNDITSALENEDIEDDNDESNEDNNENNETITNLQASFQTRITTLTQTLNRLTARTLAIRYQRLHFQINPTASLSNQDTQGENTQQTQLAILRLREKIIEREIGEVKAQMQALRAEIDAAVQSSDDDDDDNDNDDGEEIMEEDEEMQECNHEHNMDDGDGATTEEIVEVDEDWLLLNNVNDNDDVDDDVLEESKAEEYDMMEDKN
ncbi:hypothetical protein D6C86_06848 [Aureobasidium pullulans]|uniref:Uncharacterized protein n=1 Tax=Aureobasidium pullulans TaxID=5580 RepID=A0A4S9VYP6_AURPU|nr:hypothetical protein D6C94_07680 [Aureobasidium pullulans]THZ44229.1 hypothetical protein D6C87_03718 [Aureobasidium pullulans]THZ57792.1 hypothetical protein D6C86_06848 [Aureobasidium pullulans]THZ96771.1 hypothetical protein D6C88_01472 [Aureobasidium pullulans]